jgi:hypothetical protein
MTGASVAVAEEENRVVGSVCAVPVEGEAFGSSGIALLDAVVVIHQAVGSSCTVCPQDDAVDEARQAVVVMKVSCATEVAVDSCVILDKLVLWGRVVGLGALLGLGVIVAKQTVVVVVALVLCEEVVVHMARYAALRSVAVESVAVAAAAWVARDKVELGGNTAVCIANVAAPNEEEVEDEAMEA